MKLLFSAILCLFLSLSLVAQQKDSTIKKNGFLASLVSDESGAPLVVDIDIIDNTSNQTVQKTQSSRIGYSRISLPSGSYKAVFSKPGYLFYSATFVILDSAGYEKKLKKIKLKKVEAGKNEVLNNVSFEENQVKLNDASYVDLDRVLALMNEIVSLKIELSGNAEDGENAERNKELSEQRAKVLIDYLVSKGVDKNRLKFSGYGAEHPIIGLVDTDTENHEDVGKKITLKVVNVGVDSTATSKNEQTQQKEVAKGENKKSNTKDKNSKKVKTAFVVEKQEEKPTTDTVQKTPELAVVPENKDEWPASLSEQKKEEAPPTTEKQEEKPVEEPVQKKEEAPVVVEKSEETPVTETVQQIKEESVVAEKQEAKPITDTVQKTPELAVVPENKDEWPAPLSEQKKEEAAATTEKQEEKPVEEPVQKKEEAPVVFEKSEETPVSETVQQIKEESVVAEKQAEKPVEEPVQKKEEVPVVVEKHEEKTEKEEIKNTETPIAEVEKKDEWPTPIEKKEEPTSATEKQEQKEITKIRNEGVVLILVADEQGQHLVADIEIVDNATNQTVQKVESNAFGYSSISLLPGSYKAVFSKPDYLFYSVNFEIKDSAGYEKKLKKIKLRKIETGKNEVLNSVSFEQNKLKLNDASYLDLDRILALMNEIVSLKIELSGNVEEGATAEANKELSEQRAKVLIDYLVSKGVDRNRLKFTGYDAERPIIGLVELDPETEGLQQEDVGKKITLKVLNVDGGGVINTNTEQATPQELTANESTQTIQKTQEQAVVTENKEEGPIPKSEQKQEVANEANQKQEEKVVTEPIQKNEETPLVTESKEEKSIAEPVQKTEEVPVVVEKQEDKPETEQEVVKGISSDSISTRIGAINTIINHAGNAINSEFPDFGAQITADGSTMVFTSRRPLDPRDIKKGKVGNGYIYISHFDNRSKSWSAAQILDKTVNAPNIDNVAVALSNDGQRMLINRESATLIGTSDIYESVLNGDEWGEATKLPEPINSDDNETSASISPDGNTIYFISNRKGGIGGKDIWTCTKDKFGKWGVAINLGDVVNTTEDEEYVYIHPNGNALFFSSKGHYALGGFDIYMSTFNDLTGQWGTPENLGSTLNTTADDIHFVVTADGKNAYYTSFEAEGEGGNDIYNITFDKPISKRTTVLLKGVVIDEHGRFLKSKITLADQLNDKPIGTYNSNRAVGKYLVSLPNGKNYNVRFSAKGYTSFVEPIETYAQMGYGEFSKIILLESKNSFISGKIADESGTTINALVEVIDKSNKQLFQKLLNTEEGDFKVDVPSGKNFGIIFSKPGYFFQSVNVVMPNAIGYEKNLKTITLQKIEVGKKAILNNVSFETNKAVLKPELFSDLDLLAKLMSEMPTLQIEVADYANNIASNKVNQALSKERAKVVADYLIGKGCDIKRIRSASYESKTPIIVADKKEQAPDRIEFKIMKLDSKIEQPAAENKMKEIADAVTKLMEEAAAEQADSVAEPEVNPELALEQTDSSAIAVSEYETMDSALVVGDSTLGEGEIDPNAVVEAEPSPFDSLKIDIVNMGAVINSSFEDYTPLITADGGMLLFTSRRPLNDVKAQLPKPVKGKVAKAPLNKENIFSSSYDESLEQWEFAAALKPVVNSANTDNAAMALSNDGQWMLMNSGEANSKNKGDLLESFFSGEEWSKPNLLPAQINSAQNETSASISPDGKTIYFISDRTGGAGGKDIWYCTKNDRGIWGEAMPIGEPLNTDKDEESVFIHPNGNTLFFSSKGHNTTGGYDIFMSEYIDSASAWEQPKNLGTLINTAEDELHFVMTADGKTAYYSTSKLSGFGIDDIYRINLDGTILKKNTTLLKGFVQDERGKGVKARIVVKDKADERIVGSYTSLTTDGKYLISLPNGKKYELKVIAPNHTNYVRTIDLSEKTQYSDVVKNIVLENKNAFISSKVFDGNGKPISTVRIEVVDKMAKQLIERTESDSEGYSRIAIPSNKKIDIVFTKPGYLFQSMSVNIPKSATDYEKDLKSITMQKLEKGKKTVLHNVTFDFNQSTIKQESFLDLARVAELMRNTGSLQIEISDHLDNLSDTKELQKLSKERAQAIADRLIAMGVEKKRIRFKSYGVDEPISTNGTEEGRALNRRVELKVLKVDTEAETAAAEKRLKEEPLTEQESNPFSNETLLDSKDSVAINVKKQEDAAKETPVEEKKEEVVKETPVEEKKEEVVKETPVEEKKEEVVKETPVEEKKEEVVKETPVEEKKEEVVKETPVEEKKEEVVKETPVEEKKEEVVKETPVEEKKEEVVKETPVEEKKESVPAENSKIEKSVTAAPLPEQYKKYDTDKDGTISYKEIIQTIDTFFDSDSTIPQEDIYGMIDLFFGD